MAEWTIAPDSKSGVGVTSPRVRIPPSPPCDYYSIFLSRFMQIFSGIRVYCCFIFCIIQCGCWDNKGCVVDEACGIPLDAFISDCNCGVCGGILTASIDQEPKTFNPIASVDGYSAMAHRLLFGTLLEYDYENQQLIPSLAKDYEIEEDKVYRFTIRRGIQWSDGAAFTIDDVTFTFDVLLSTGVDGKLLTNSPLSYNFIYNGSHLKYRKINDSTIEFKTPRVCASFLENLTKVYILPKHKLEKFFKAGNILQQWSLQTAIDEPNELVGLGPFRIKSFRAGERLVLTKNPFFWKFDKSGQRLPYIDHYITQHVENNTTKTILFATGQTDAAPISPADYSWVKKMENVYNYTVYDRGPEAKFICFYFNQNTGLDSDGKNYVQPHKLKWFRNEKFRQAILLSLDREGIVQSKYFGRGEVLHSFLHRIETKWYNHNVIKYSQNINLAKQILKNNGFYWDNNGTLFDDANQKVEFNILWESSGAGELIPIFKKNLLELGIKVKIISLDLNALLHTIHTSYKYDSATIGFKLARDPNLFKQSLKSSGSKHVWFPNQTSPSTDWEAQIDDLFEKQAQTLNYPKRKEIWDQIQLILSEKLPWLPLFAPHHYTGIKNKWKNIRVPAKGNILWNIEEVYLDPS